MNGIGKRPKSWISDPPSAATTHEEALWGSIGTSVDAISFGFVATAILISMFLIMAIVEHILRQRASFLQHSQNDHQASFDPDSHQSQMHSVRKLERCHTVSALCPSDLSVLMPGQQYPTYIAQPAPLPCPRQGIYWPSHEHPTGSSS